jgi:hypothetical protein
MIYTLPETAPASTFFPVSITNQGPEAGTTMLAPTPGRFSFLHVASGVRRARAATSWFSEARKPSPARWECGNRALGDFQGAVGNVGNRSLVFQVFHGPGISTALRNISACVPSLNCCSHGITSSGRGGGLGAPTARAALEQVPVVEQPVQHGADGGGIAEQFAPVLDRAVGSQQRAGPFVAAHDDLQ